MKLLTYKPSTFETVLSTILPEVFEDYLLNRWKKRMYSELIKLAKDDNVQSIRLAEYTEHWCSWKVELTNE